MNLAIETIWKLIDSIDDAFRIFSNDRGGLVPTSEWIRAQRGVTRSHGQIGSTGNHGGHASITDSVPFCADRARPRAEGSPNAR